MGWIISQALYEKWHCSQGQAVEFSEDIYSDGKQSAPLSGNPTQLAYLPLDKMTKFSRLSQFGMTFKPLTAERGEDLLTWFREDFLARTYPAQEKAQALTESDPACGVRWLELSARYDLDSCSWRTHQCLWDEALHWSSVILPRWGMTVNGVLFQHPTAERPISGTGSGLWPTPRSCSAMAATITPENSWDQNRFPNLETIVGRNMWPTPTASQARSEGMIKQMRAKVELGEITIEQAEAMIGGSLTPKRLQTWPTPQSRDWKGSSGRSMKGLECDLPTAVKWPTPTAHNAKETNAPSEANRNEPTLACRVGGHLNPMWVEWLMGWPLGWTDLKPLAMDRFQCARLPHSNCSLVDNNVKCWKCMQQVISNG